MVISATTAPVSSLGFLSIGKNDFSATQPKNFHIHCCRTKIGDFISKWEDPYVWSDRLDPDFLDYHFEDHDADNDPLVIAAVAAAQNPVFKTTINVTLALRKTLRRYLGIEPAVPDSEMG